MVYNETTLDWGLYDFSFTPFFRESNIEEAGLRDYVYRINITDDTADKGFHGMWGSEPYKNTAKSSVVKWNIDHLRFHWPAEHTFMGATAQALEMQIFTKVSND